MERTIKPTNGLTTMEKQILAMQSQIVARAQLANTLGQSYGGNRDLYQALGYKKDLAYTDFEAQYLRQDIAKAVIDRPAKATWQGELIIQDSTEVEETPLEKAWKELYKRLKLKNVFNRVDRLAGLGRFGIILLGLDDIANIEGFVKPAKKGSKLLYVKPFGEGSVIIEKYETDTKNPRYGMPLLYKIKVADISKIDGNTSPVLADTEVKIHYTRIVHVIDDVLENETLGLPRLEAIFNRLMDLEKITGGDAEMFWRSARPGFQGIVDKDYQMTQEVKDDLKAQIDEYEHKLRRILVNEGVKYEALEQLVADPANHVDIQLQMISAVTGIPKRILTGTERGELSSNQDASEWRGYIKGRREDHAEPHIVEPFVDQCIEIGILPPAGEEGYKILWSDLFAMSEAERVKIGLDRSQSLRNYTSSPMSEAVIAPEQFFEHCMGLSEEQIEAIKSGSDSEILKEQKKIMEMITPETETKPAQEGEGTKIGAGRPNERTDKKAPRKVGVPK